MGKTLKQEAEAFDLTLTPEKRRVLQFWAETYTPKPRPEVLQELLEWFDEQVLWFEGRPNGVHHVTEVVKCLTVGKAVAERSLISARQLSVDPPTLSAVPVAERTQVIRECIAELQREDMHTAANVLTDMLVQDTAAQLASAEDDEPRCPRCGSANWSYRDGDRQVCDDCGL